MRKKKSINKKHDPFLLEELRDKFASKGEITRFLRTYKEKLPEITNLNTSAFWDEKIIESEGKCNENPIYRDKLNRIVRFLKNRKGKILDVGFGYADLERKLKEKNFELDVYGLDISREAVRNAKKLLRGDYRQGNILDLHHPSLFFDYVIALDILEHVPTSKTLQALSEIRRILKKNGYLLVSVPINEGLESLVRMGINPNGHVRVYSYSILELELKISGFEIIKQNYLTAFKNYYFIKRILIKLLPKGFRKPNLLIVFARKV